MLGLMAIVIMKEMATPTIFPTAKPTATAPTATVTVMVIVTVKTMLTVMATLTLTITTITLSCTATCKRKEAVAISKKTNYHHFCLTRKTRPKRRSQSISNH